MFVANAGVKTFYGECLDLNNEHQFPELITTVSVDCSHTDIEIDAIFYIANEPEEIATTADFPLATTMTISNDGPAIATAQ